MPSNSGLTFCGGEDSGKTELCKVLRNPIWKVLGVSDCIQSLHNFSPFSAISVTLIQIETYCRWVLFESTLLKELKNQYLYSFRIY